MTRFISLILVAMTLTTPAVAQDRLPPASADAELRFRIAPQITSDFDDTIIELGAAEVIAPSETMPDARIFARFDGATPLTREDRKAIEAEIAQRFGRNTGATPVQTGLIFEPDLSMILKPLDASGTLRDSRF